MPEPLAEVVPIPLHGVVSDARGEGRVLRATWHEDAGVVVLSLWQGGDCRATARLRPAEVAELVGVLSAGLGSLAARSGG
jgi:hypothetical protein